MQPRAVAVADPDHGAGPRFQHEGKILRAHHRRIVGVDALAADDLAGDLRREIASARSWFAQHRIIALVGQLGGRAVKLRGAFDDFVQALLQADRAPRATGCARCRATARSAE